MSKTLKRTLAGLAMVALLWGGAKIVKPLLQSSSAMAGLGRAQPPRDPETITVTMGGVTMKIPKSYLLFPPSPGGKGSRRGFIRSAGPLAQVYHFEPQGIHETWMAQTSFDYGLLQRISDERRRFAPSLVYILKSSKSRVRAIWLYVFSTFWI